MRVLRNQSGVAMITVLLVGASMTAVTSAAAFVTIKEFGAGSDDRKAATALAYAEAGVDRFMEHLKRGQYTFASINQAGCDGNPEISIPQGTIGNGTYTASLKVYDPFAIGPARFAEGGACDTRPTSPHPGQDGADNTYFVITSTGQHPEAKRVVRQIIAIAPLRLPVGIFANFVSKQSSKHDFDNISMLAKSAVTDRENLYFSGDDNYYLMQDFYPDGVSGHDPMAPAKASVHSAGTIYLKSSSKPQFEDSTKNCSAEKQSNNGQSLWDSDGSSGSGPITSGCSGQTGYPLTSKFTNDMLDAIAQPVLSESDYEIMKDAAKTQGVYCSFNGAGPNDGKGDKCIRQSAAMGGAAYATYIQDVLNGTGTPANPATNTVMAYFDFRSGTPSQNNIGLLGTVWGCDALDPDNTKTLVAVVRNGGIDFSGSGGQMINGALIMDGDYQGNGALTMNGSVIVGGTAHFHSSAQNFTLNECWVDNMPGSFFGVTPGKWTEVDR